MKSEGNQRGGEKNIPRDRDIRVPLSPRQSLGLYCVTGSACYILFLASGSAEVALSDSLIVFLITTYQAFLGRAWERDKPSFVG